jgi:hypothetical protein
MYKDSIREKWNRKKPFIFYEILSFLIQKFSCPGDIVLNL